MLLRVTENAVAGYIWPAGRYLPTPGVVENVMHHMHHSRATFEALKQVICFSKQNQNYGKMCQGRQLSSVQPQNFTTFCSFHIYIMLLILIHELKCETNLTLLSM